MYSFYLDGVRLPITPKKLTVKVNGNNKTLTLLNGGEMNFLRSPELTEISFEAVLPMLGKYPFSGEYRQPDFYLALFEKLMAVKKPFRFKVIRSTPAGRLLFDTDMQVSLESYTMTEEATEGFDITVAITLKQYVAYATKKITVSASAKDAEPALNEDQKRDTGNKVTPKTYTVQRGDCLWLIAKKLYGDGAQYTKIYAANKDKIKNPNLIYAGQVLIIP